MTRQFNTPFGSASVGAVILTAGALLMAGCQDVEQKDKNVIRSIQWMEMRDGAAEQQRLIAGIVKPVDSTALSFESGGKIAKLHIDLGDKVRTGDVIAELDARPFKLKVDAAQANLARAKAVFQDRRQEYERQKKLFEGNWVAQAKVDAVLAAFEAAKSEVRAVASQLKLAERDLEMAVIRAPFDGAISRKSANAFQEVAAGQTIVQLSGESELEIVTNVPPSLINRLKVGKAMGVRFPSLPDSSVKAEIREIGSRAQEANSFPVKLRLSGPVDGLHAGMSAEIAFTFASTASVSAAFMAPLSAILAGEAQEHYVFVYDAKSSSVTRRKIVVRDIRNNRVEITGDLKGGEIIATAGVPFLREGQKVQLLSGEAPYGAGNQS